MLKKYGDLSLISLINPTDINIKQTKKSFDNAVKTIKEIEELEELEALDKKSKIAAATLKAEKDSNV